MRKKLNGAHDDTIKSVLPHLKLIENDLHPKKYVACINDQNWYIGAITEYFDVNKDVYIKFMKQNYLFLTWLNNECWISINDLIFIINIPQQPVQSG